MGGSSKGAKKTENSTQTSLPPAWAMPLFAQQARDAMDLYRSGEGGNVYQGKRVADLSDGTKNVVSGLADTAKDFRSSSLENLINTPTASGANLAEMAAGSFLKEGNPYYKQRLNQEINDMASTVNSKMSGAGRLNSGANSDILAKNTSSMLLQGLENDYDRASQNMLAANEKIDRANQNQLAGAGRFLTDESNAFKNALEGQNALDRHAQDKVDADWSKWRDEDNKGWNRLGLLEEAMKSSASNYGTSSGQKKYTQSSDPFSFAGNFVSKLIGK